MLTKFEEEEEIKKITTKDIRFVIERVKDCIRGNLGTCVKAYRTQRNEETFYRTRIFSMDGITIDVIPGPDFIEILGITDAEYEYLIQEHIIR